MLDKFWEAAGEKFADRWASVAGPAVLFWAGGLLAWLWQRGTLHGLDRWTRQEPETAQLVVLLAALAGVAASGLLVQRLTAPVLRLAEGYWPAPLKKLRGRRIGAIGDQVKDLETRFQELAGPVLDSRTATAADRAKFADLDQRLRRFPADGDYLPTRIGNILRAAERRPADKYGLDATVLWPRLWLLLPADAREELGQARSALDAAVAAGIWAFLFLGFTYLTYWAAIPAIAVLLISCLRWIPERAEVYADLVEAAFDLHRLAVYEQLRWPLPANPQQELRCGAQLTAYLLRGATGTDPAFTPPG